MHFQALAAISTLAVASMASPIEAPVDGTMLEERASCPNVIVYGVRGSSTNPTTNSDPAIYSALPAQFTQIANAAFAKAGGGTLQAIAYPASDPNVNNGANYGTSVGDGIASLQDTIYAFIKQCANSKIVVLGYSQGAQVVSGALAGSRYRGPLKAMGRVTAGAIIADPTYQDGRFPVDAGSGANNGMDGTVPGDGSKYDFLNKNFGTRVRSYCQAGDKFCDSGTGTDAVTIHTNAPAVFEGAAQSWVTGLL